MFGLITTAIVCLLCGCSLSTPPTAAEEDKTRWYGMNWEERASAGKMLTRNLHMGDHGTDAWTVVTNFPCGEGSLRQTVLINEIGDRVVALAGKNLPAGTKAKIWWYEGQYSQVAAGLFSFPVVEEDAVEK